MIFLFWFLNSPIDHLLLTTKNRQLGSLLSANILMSFKSGLIPALPFIMFVTSGNSLKPLNSQFPHLQSENTSVPTWLGWCEDDTDCAWEVFSKENTQWHTERSLCKRVAITVTFSSQRAALPRAFSNQGFYKWELDSSSKEWYCFPEKKKMCSK